jgi:glycosyltransferase 2 family protein
VRRGGARRELTVGLLSLGATLAATSRTRLGRWELGWFHALNDLPDELYAPIWMVMQLGALGAVPATAGTALVLGERRLATRLMARGATAWVLAKLVKASVRRPRPAALIEDLRIRGRAQSGGGFPSGHAGVATAMAAAALLSMDGDARPLLTGLAATVAAARVYVGAHLPLDVLGGAALGLIVDGAMGLRADGSA